MGFKPGAGAEVAVATGALPEAAACEVSVLELLNKLEPNQSIENLFFFLLSAVPAARLVGDNGAADDGTPDDEGVRMGGTFAGRVFVRRLPVLAGVGGGGV